LPSAIFRAFARFSDSFLCLALISCFLLLHEGFWNAEDSLAGSRRPDELESPPFAVPLKLLLIPSASPSPEAPLPDH
jgi:hypothetical protein